LSVEDLESPSRLAPDARRTVSPRLQRLLDDPSPAAADEVWRAAAVTGTPLIDPWDDGQVLVTFLWRGTATSTRAWWGVDVPLARVPGTDLWHGSELFPADLRTVYCLSHDGAESAPPGPSPHGRTHVDQFNRQPFRLPRDPDDPADHDQWLSVLEGPAAPAEMWSTPRPGVTPGDLVHTGLTSEALGGERPVTVYLPVGHRPDDRPTLVVFDGFQARHGLRFPTTLDNLIAAGRIPPVTALFVNSHVEERDRMLSATPPIASFVAGELLPWAHRTFRAGAASGNLIAGVSRGGLAAAYVALQAPALFGGVIAHSGSFWWPSPAEGEPGRLIRRVLRREPAGLRFYLDVGLGEQMPGPGGAPSQLVVNRAMRDVLARRGYAVTYAEYPGAHDYVNWRRTFADGLLALLGDRT
jgi:enterochelin esterase-like enzyme